MPAYGDAEYWDKRYTAEPTCFDWYLTYAALEPVLTRFIPRDANILQLGVGTSLLQAQMVEQGSYQRVLSVDVSTVAIKHMEQLHAKLPQLKYRVADARSMPQFKDASFDAILDKGTLDSLMCSPEAGSSSIHMLQECARLLSPTGVMLNITYGEPASRVRLFQSQGWDVSFYVISKPKQPAAGAPAGSATGSTAVQGPLEAAAQASLDSFSHLADEAYFVYVLTRHADPAAATAAAAAGGGGAAGPEALNQAAASP